MKFSIKDFFIECDQIRSFLRIWSHLLKKSLMENFNVCVVLSYTHDTLDVKNVYYIKSTKGLERCKRCKSPSKVPVLIKLFLWAILVKNLGKYFNHFKIVIKVILVYFIMKVFCKL